jgi:predicted dehydrogenase
MLRAIENDGGAAPDFEQANHVQYVVEAAYRSIESGTWSPVPPRP